VTNARSSLYTMSLATWGAVAPMNRILAQWEPGPIPANFATVRDRWEAGHIANTAIKTVGLCCTIAAVVSLTGPHATAGS
jgi:hypothetical protein